MKMIGFVFLLNCILLTSAVDQEYTITEEEPIGPENSKIGDLRTVFLNSGINVENAQFGLFKSDQRADIFDVHKTKGILFVKKRVDREALCPNAKENDCHIDFGVYVGQANDRVTVRVTVLDKNDNTPRWNSPVLHVAFVEQVGPGSSKTIPAARDSDVGQNAKLEYRLENEGAPFKLIREGSKLILDASAMLDREHQANYNLTLKAWDSGSPSRTGSVLVKVEVLDLNDNPPRFTRTDYSTRYPVKEDVKIGKVVLTLKATDADSGKNSRLRFNFSKLDTPTQRLAQQYFKIRPNGDIAVIKKLDYDRLEQKYFSFEAMVEDSAPAPYGKSASASVTIRVSDVNDEKPTMQVCFFPDGCVPSQRPRIPENTQSGSTVAEVRVSDLDYDGKDKVACKLGKSVEKFALAERYNSDSRAPRTFELKTRGYFDREKRAFESVTIICTDAAHHSTSKRIDIKITDTNDNDPVFDNPIMQLTVPENDRTSAKLYGRIKATDKDEGRNAEIKYSIQGEENNALFKIDENTGEMSAKISFDREHKEIYDVTVLATDKGDPPRSCTGTVKVIVKDTNDQEPQFSQQHYEMSVLENKPAGTRVGQVSATDGDVGINAKITYTFLDHWQTSEAAGDFDITAKNYFDISRNTGVITTRAKLDREKTRIYNLRVRATDNGRPQRSSYSRVTVNVEDENDNAPVFETPDPNDKNSVMRLNGREPGQKIGMVKATDEDGSKITYSIANLRELDYRFGLDTSGMLFLAKSLRGVRKTEWKINIRACDDGQPKPKCTILKNAKVRLDNSQETDGPTGHKTNTPGGGARSGDNEAIVVFLAIIFGILLIALAVIIFMLRRKAVLMRKQRMQQGISSGATGTGKSLEPPAYEPAKELPPMYEEQRRPEGEFLLAQQGCTELKNTKLDVISPKRKRHHYTTTTPRSARNAHKTQATELPERPRSACSADYQTLDSVCGTMRHPRATTVSHHPHGLHQLHARYANTNSNGEALIYPASLHTYYEIKGKDTMCETETGNGGAGPGDCSTTFRPIREGSADDSYNNSMDPGVELANTAAEGLTASTSLSHTSGQHSKGPSMCVDRAATLSRTQYPFSPYAEASFV